MLILIITLYCFYHINKGLVNDHIAERLARDGVTLLKEIGHGAFGIVYKANYMQVVKEKKTSRLVAVKLLKGIVIAFSSSNWRIILKVQDIFKYHIFVKTGRMFWM